MARTSLTISSRNYSSWSLRGWLLTKFSGLEFEEIVVPPADPSIRAELLLLSPSILVPGLEHVRAHCRSVCGEMHSEFSALRSALPMNLRAHCPGFKVWERAQGDIDPIITILHDCQVAYGGPLSVRRMRHGRCHVRAGRHPVSDL
jgi:glutathione S-transferase